MPGTHLWKNFRKIFIRPCHKIAAMGYYLMMPRFFSIFPAVTLALIGAFTSVLSAAESSTPREAAPNPVPVVMWFGVLGAALLILPRFRRK
jgi:hypothetical protein